MGTPATYKKIELEINPGSGWNILKVTTDGDDFDVDFDDFPSWSNSDIFFEPELPTAGSSRPSTSGLPNQASGTATPKGKKRASTETVTSGKRIKLERIMRSVTLEHRIGNTPTLFNAANLAARLWASQNARNGTSADTAKGSADGSESIPYTTLWAVD